MLEKELGRKADRRRKLDNGTIETQFYQFHGTRPKREIKE
jgi:putative N6-adenine-specific DNA methylase